MKTALAILDRDFRTPFKGSRVRISRLVEGLRRLGYRMVYVAPDRIWIDPLIGPDDLVFRTSATPFSGGRLARFEPTPYESAIARACLEARPDLALAEYAWLAPALAWVRPRCPRLVDAHDVLHERCALLSSKGLDPWISCSADEEIERLRFADGVMAIQESEAQTFRALLPNRSVETVPFEMQAGASEWGRSTGEDLLFVGSDHTGNYGVQRFVTRAMPAIRRRRPQARLRVYGNIAAQLSPAPGVELEGITKDLGSAYARAALAVCPIEAGSGLKIKTVEALGHGRTVVGTPHAFQGMPSPAEEAWSVARSWSQFADAVVALLENGSRRRALEQAATRYVERHYSERAVSRALLRSIKSATAVVARSAARNRAACRTEELLAVRGSG